MAQSLDVQLDNHQSADTNGGAVEEERAEVGNAEVRYVGHFMQEEDDRRGGRHELLLLDATDAVPEIIQNEVRMMREVEEVVRRIATYQIEEMRLDFQFPQPGWRITIPIR